MQKHPLKHLNEEQAEIGGIFFNTTSKIKLGSTKFSPLVSYFKKLQEAANQLNKSYKKLNRSKQQVEGEPKGTFQWSVVEVFYVEEALDDVEELIKQFVPEHSTICTKDVFNPLCYRTSARVVEFINATEKTIRKIEGNINVFKSDPKTRLSKYNMENLYIPDGWYSAENEQKERYLYNSQNTSQTFYID